jgi:cyclophilin family peptidyl-prolyl cis-trans isomerase
LTNKNNPIVYIDIATKKQKFDRIYIELFKNIVPKTCNNFMKLCTNKTTPNYLGCNIHRIIPGFMIQGGDFENGNGTGGYSIYGKMFEDESFAIPHSKCGLLSMANSGKNTNGSQFFITLDKTPHLNNKHVVFGQVIYGMDIVKKIEQYGTENGTTTEIVKIVGAGVK